MYHFRSINVLYLIKLSFQKIHTKLAKALDCAEKLDECKGGVVIDVDLAIEEAKKVDVIVELWLVDLK